MFRTLVITRHTFREAVVQPIYALLLALGAAVLLVFAALPFFTFGEDTIMFKAVALDLVLLLVLVATLFATSKSIYEEIEDRTMLTLMSKPIKKWEVLIGKYLGIILAALLAVAILGLVMALCVWWRIPTDYQLQSRSLDERELKQIFDYRIMNLMGLLPSLLLMWLQISVLAAISVAISTRVSLVVNLPTVIILYIAGNLTRFLFPINFTRTDSGGTLADSSMITKAFAYVIGNVVPFLATFDIRQKAIYSHVAVPGTMFAQDPTAVSLGALWGYAGVATLYAIAYATFALAVGMLLFQTRELGGGEG